MKIVYLNPTGQLGGAEVSLLYILASLRAAERVWSRPRRVHTVWHVHDYVRPRPVMARLLRGCAARCRAVVANSKSVAEDVQSVCGDRVKVYTVYNAIDLSRFCPAGPTLDLDAMGGLPPSEAGIMRVALVGTFAWWKGHKTFLQAISLLPPSLPIRAYVVGGPIYRTRASQYSLNELRSLAAELKISHKVGFTGFVEDSASAMRSLDIVVHASIRPEPFGLVIVEAMACGRALIASKAGGAAEILELGKNALGHPPGDAAVLAKRIEELASNPDLRARLGKAGRATAELRFARARLAKDWVIIYRRVINACPAYS